MKILDLLFDHLPLAMFAKDPKNEFRIIHWNKHAEDLWRIKKEDAIGKMDIEFFSPDSARFFYEMDVRTMQQKKVVFIEREMIENATIGRRWLRTWKIPVFDPKTGEPLYLLGVSQDITELVESEHQKEHAEQVMVTQREKLSQASRLAALGEMSGGVAHEINSPLGVISLHAEVALSLLDQQDVPMENIRQHLLKIQETTFRIAKIVQTMKSVARNSSSDQFEWVSCGALLDDLIALSQHRLRHLGVRVNRKNIPASLNLHCRSVQISQVFLNLLNNSIDAVQKLEERWAEIECVDREDEWIEFRFVDSGRGLPEEVRGRLFDTFFTTKGSKEGTGLGLSISKGILQSHGGDLFLDPSGPHTTFVILFPKRRIKHL